jgi:hypothetical protein
MYDYLKYIWINIENLIVIMLGFNFIVLWFILFRYTFASYRLSAMTDKIKRDGNLENFKIPISKYLFNLDFLDDLTLSIPTENKYQQIQEYHLLSNKIKIQRKYLRRVGIPFLFLVCILLTAMIIGFVD